MSVSVLFSATDRFVGRLAGPPARLIPSLAMYCGIFSAAATLAACSPYPDDGEFLAGVVYAQNFMAGVKKPDLTPAVGRGRPIIDGNAPYTVIQTTNASAGAAAVSTTSPATSPFWTNAGKRQPLDRGSAQQVYVFDGSCAAPRDYQYDYRLDLIRLDRQYPIFADIPEVLSTNSGRGGRTGNYSAVVEVIHLAGSGSRPCQSIKRFDTAQARIGEAGDLQEGVHEYRLLQIIDPANAAPPYPIQLGFYNQLVVPYIDMGPVPIDPSDGKTFRTMPIFKVQNAAGMAAGNVILGRLDEAGPAYSPICREYTLKLAAGMMLPGDAGDPLFMGATKTENLSSCIVCQPIDDMGNLACPFADSQVTP
jgi:hypothetical protein